MNKLLEQVINDVGTTPNIVQTPVDEGLGPNIAAGVLATSLALGNPAVSQATKPKITHSESTIDQEKLLQAIKKVESSGGVDKRDRYEAGIERQLRKRFNKLSPTLQAAIKKYGYKRVSTSYGPWQMLASTAYDLGFTGAPEELRAEATLKPLVLKYLKSLIGSTKTSKVEDVISAYNAGLGGIGTNPNYISKVLKHYKV